jgi:peptidoglycan/LPS O-acetylase OafA/YrhL
LIALTIIVAVVVASLILYRVIEKPVDEIRQRLASNLGTSLQPQALQAINVAAQT